MKRLLMLALGLISMFSSTAHASITADQFNKILDDISLMYRPSIEGAGGILDVRRQFTYPEPVGSARRYEGHWIVEIWGGFPAQPEMTPESFALITCHEFAHHLGGAPYFTTTSDTWASSEGQADYFAAQQCLPVYLKNFIAAEREENPLPIAAKYCESSQDIHCTRVVRAAFELSVVTAHLQKNSEPSLESFDPTVVIKTSDQHLIAQCRLDTYLAGYFGRPRPKCWYLGSN